MKWTAFSKLTFQLFPQGLGASLCLFCSRPERQLKRTSSLRAILLGLQCTVSVYNSGTWCILTNGVHADRDILECELCRKQLGQM